MDVEVKVCRSLPPFVEGKIHGTLKLIIDEVFWIKKSPGSIMVVAFWWGEHNSAQFRPIDYITGITRTNEDKIKIYAIKTNAMLFEDYIKNCKTIELMIIIEKTKEVIGTAHVDLSMIFEYKLSSQFIPILNDNGNKLGQLHVSLQLTYLTKFQNIQSKMCRYSKEQVDNDVILSTINNLQSDREVVHYKNLDNTKGNSMKPIKIDMNNTYRSFLKTKREFQEYKKKQNEIVTDKLISQIVARAQQLRGAILKETYNEDPLALSDSSMSNELYPCTSVENEAKLYEYILGKEMTFLEEKRALDTLKVTSPTSSLIDLASKTIMGYENNNMNAKLNKNFSTKQNNPAKNTLQIHPLDYVNSIRIFIESFVLSPAGYRRARSTCLQYGVPLSLTYLVQYETTFGSIKQNVKSNKGTKFTRICAKKQVDQVIDFNAEAVYNISREITDKNFPLKFKLFVKHFNNKLITELGCGSVNINDIANTINLSNTQNIIITNKGIKIGELKVTIELGSDSIYFGKEFVDAVTSTKENIPILEIKSPLTMSGNKYKTTTGTHSSKSSSKVSSAKRIECLTNDNNKDLLTAKNMAEHQKQSLDNKKIDISNPENTGKDKVLLHGLIYVAEGKDLPESNTYLICRAFWREDKATSQICNNTENPFYHFFQLVPLIHGTELLERIRDNYIIIEVYSRQNGRTDNLLGIAKLPVHQLYVAYRDPLILPHLLLSKYPVISVDDWVNINDPINGKYCGKLFALVALGTAEQITLLEVSRGLRNTSIISRSSYNYHCVPDNTNCTSVENGSQCNVPEVLSLNSEQFLRDDNFVYHVYNMPDRDSASVNYKTQESQTDISSLKDVRPEKLVQETVSSQQLVLHALVDRLANVLHVNKTNTDQSAQTNEAEEHREGICLNTLNSNSLIDDNDSCSPRNDFQLPEMYRSVGVGAEYDDEELDQQQNDAFNNVSDSSITEENTNKKETNISQSCDNFFFRTVVEIECALHLPKIKRLNDSVEPSTYVTFQNTTHKLNSSDQLNSHVTNVFPYSCDPKWNWRCDTKLPTDLLLNNQKRLILKVWYLNDPDTSIIINLEKDVVIGFSAIDLSVLMTGFPIVSGWFHIMDFNGKCNGQIKITITPLDSLLTLRNFIPNSIINLPSCSSLSQANLPYMYSVLHNTESSIKNTQQILPNISSNQNKLIENEYKQNDFIMNVGCIMENTSISLLSLSLKQKLTELDEITKRLQSRLHEVTNTIFDDDFDNDFDMIEQNSDNENTDDKNVENTGQIVSVHSVNATTQITKQCETKSDQNFIYDERQISSIRNSNYDPQPIHTQKTINCEPIDTDYSSSNTRFSQDPGYCQYNQSIYQKHGSTRTNYLSDNIMEYPPRGTKTHINHLLDKLSLDLPPRPPPETTMPMKKNILELFASLREHRNNWQDQNTNKNDRDVNICSVVTQTDKDINEQYSSSRATNFACISDSNTDENITKSFQQVQPRNKISTVIREELIADEDNDNSNCDELSTYLITSNIRHMNLDGIFNPLLYQYLIPDLQVSSAMSPESKAVEQLDNRYDMSFDRMTHDNRIYQSTDNDASCRDVQTKSRINILESMEESAEFFRLTPSGVSANVDNNIHVTLIHKINDNDLMSANSTESIAASFDKLSLEQADAKMENHCSIMSELSVPGVSRQAPEGGNPIEEIKTSIAMKGQDDIMNVSAVS